MRRTAAPVMLATILLAACALPMKLPDGLDAGSRLDIAGFPSGIGSRWDHHFRIGSYEIAEIRRSGWTKGRGWKLPFFWKHRKERNYSFVVRAQGRTLAARCVVSLESNMFDREEAKQPGFSCKCSEGDSVRAALELRVSEHEPIPRWEADLGALDINMWAVTESPSGWNEGGRALGYQVSSIKGVGAFEVRDEGRAFLPPKLDEDERLGAICSYGAVMLYEPIESD